jgi:uncharacterized protein
MMNRHTGRPITMLEHIKQSVVDILTTPLGSRVMRRDYGSRLYELIDAPTNAQFDSQVYFAVAQALYRWEPRIQVKQVKVNRTDRAHIEIILNAVIVLKQGQRVPLNMTVPFLQEAA